MNYFRESGLEIGPFKVLWILSSQEMVVKTVQIIQITHFFCFFFLHS